MDMTQSSVSYIYDSDDDNVFGYKSLGRHRRTSKEDCTQSQFSQSQTQNQTHPSLSSLSIKQKKSDKQSSKRNSQKPSQSQSKSKRKKASNALARDPTFAKPKVETSDNDICMKKSKSSSSLKKQKAKEKTPKRMPRKVHEGFCPLCQMPFKILTIESPNWHLTECLQKQIKDNECPNGLECDCTIESHYHKFSHTLLASQRAGLTRKSSSRKLEFKSSMVEANNEHITPDLVQKHVSADVCVKEETLDDINECAMGNSVFATIDLNTVVDPVQPSLKTVPSAPIPSQIKDIVHKSDFPRSLNANHINEPLLQDSEQTLLNDDTDMESDNDVPQTSAVSPYTSLKKENTVREETFTVGQQKPARVKEYIDLEHDSSESEDDIFDNLLNQATPSQFKKSQDKLEIDENRNKVEAWLGSISTTNTKDLSELLSNISDSDEAESDKVDNAPVKSTKDNQEHSTQPFKSSTVTNDLIESIPNKQSNMETSSYFYSTVDAISKPFTALKSAMKAKQSSIMGFFGAPDNKNAASAVVEHRHPKNNIQPQRKNEVQPKKMAQPKNVVQHKKTAQATEVKSNSKNNGWNRQCPFYKKIPGTPFTVDAFRYGVVADCKAYFLTHFHYDHYGGLTKKFAQPIYCSNVTANLIEQKLKVEPHYVHRLPMNEPCQIHGVQVTLLEANHCPGAVLILFETSSGQTYLHTGDFRANPDMENYPQLINKRIDKLYLDTTYCDPTYSFPPQKDIIRLAATIAERCHYEDPNTLFVCGTYTIGKERIFTAIAQSLGSKVCVTREKKTILDCLDDAQLKSLITLQFSEAKVHVIPMKQLNFRGLSDHLSKFKNKFSRLVAFEPTGWTHGVKFSMDNPQPKLNRDNIILYGLPYSEHSSYTEMKRFVTYIRPTSILPTVNNGNPAKRKSMEKMFESWLSEESSTAKQTTIDLQQKNISTFFSKK
ncbi:unnamed protein product [Owenia fusiformis]|uniref:DNA cross-link repair 1A protein n=1 Tax=Owenia fusiformis TaxID=6347 RepID=A0A8S4NR91_OWEFU|nr:unnamed protein product [Owenia fusiformis]